LGEGGINAPRTQFGAKVLNRYLTQKSCSGKGEVGMGGDELEDMQNAFFGFPRPLKVLKGKPQFGAIAKSKFLHRIAR